MFMFVGFMKKMNKIVVKVGTSTLTQGSPKLSKRFMLSLVEQMAWLHSQGKEVILVSSGAMAAGRELLSAVNGDHTLPLKQMFASIGQVKLMQAWAELFAFYDVHVGQVLLTREDFAQQERYVNTSHTLACLLQNKIIPIINENDTIATKEIKVGDNDNLAAMVGKLVDADALILLTDQEGLYTADPRKHPDATLISTVSSIDETIFALAGGTSTGLGTGGMVTKIEAALIATQSGTRTIIASSARPRVLVDIAEGKQVGTLFVAQ
jgi:glutamate 5-kinase